MTNKIDLSSIFDVYSMRDQPAGIEAKALTQAFKKNRVGLLCQEMVHPYDHYSQAGYKIADFWMTLRDKLRYRHGLEHLADRNHYNPVTEVEQFLSECSDEHYLDFIEMFFQSEKIPMYFSDRELREAVNNINKFFNLDELPYALTQFSISESRTLRPRIERFLSRIRPRPKQLGSLIVSSHTQPQALPIRIPKIEAYPQIFGRESEVMYQTAIKPVLILLAGPAFREANREFLDALKDYRNGDYRDCVVDCGSSLESVMKIICRTEMLAASKGCRKATQYHPIEDRPARVPEATADSDRRDQERVGQRTRRRRGTTHRGQASGAVHHQRDCIRNSLACRRDYP